MRGKMAMGYCEVQTTPANPLFPPGLRMRGQVFHFSEIVQESVVGGACAALGTPPEEQGGSAKGGGAWQHGYLTQAKVPGAAEVREGFCRNNVLASYVHLHFGGCPELAAALVDKCRSVDAAAAGTAAAEAALQAAAASLSPLSTRRSSLGGSGLGQQPGSTSSSGYPSPQLLASKAGSVCGGCGGSRGDGGGLLFPSHSSPNLHDDALRMAREQQQQHLLMKVGCGVLPDVNRYLTDDFSTSAAAAAVGAPRHMQRAATSLDLSSQGNPSPSCL